MQWLRLPRRLRRVPQDPGGSQNSRLPMWGKNGFHFMIFMMSFTGRLTVVEELGCLVYIGDYTVI